MKKIICKNSSTGRTFTFEYGDVVFFQGAEDLGKVAYTNSTTKNTGEDGETVEGESEDARHPVLTAAVLSDYDNVRDQLDAVFQKGVDGYLYYYRDDGTVRMATYRPESWELPTEGVVRTLTVNLLCADPLFYDTEEEFTAMAAWKSNFMFPLTFHSPFTISEHISNLLASITNPSGAAQALRIVFTATGEVVSPYLTDVARQETLEVQTTMHNGDRITVTTSRSDMHVRLTSGGATTEITNLATWPVAWLQLQPGENLYRYGAQSGQPSLNVQIWHRQSYGGV